MLNEKYDFGIMYWSLELPVLVTLFHVETTWKKMTTGIVLFYTVDRIQDGMRELDVLKDKRDVNLCSTMALMLAHKKANSIGKLFFFFLDTWIVVKKNIYRNTCICNVNRK